MKVISNINIRQFVVLGIIALLTILTITSAFSVENAEIENEVASEPTVVQTNTEVTTSRNGIISRIRNFASDIRGNSQEVNSTLAINEEVLGESAKLTEFSDLAIGSCSVEEVDRSRNLFTFGNGNLTTAQIVIPGWNWFNSSDPYGVGASQFSSPVSIAQRSTNQELNLISDFAIPASLNDGDGEELVKIPVSANGITAFAALMDTYSTTGATEDLEYSSSLGEFISALEKIQTNFSAENEEEQIAALINEPFIDQLDINSENLDENVSLSNQDIFKPNRIITPDQSVCRLDSGPIYSYYSGDLGELEPTKASDEQNENQDFTTSLEFKLPDDIEITTDSELIIPFGNKILTDIYSLDKNSYFNTFSFLSEDAQIIHNNDCSLNVGIRLQSYNDPNDPDNRSIFQNVRQFFGRSDLSEEEIEAIEIFENQDNISPIATKEYSYQIPWLGCQPREFAKRASITLNNIYSGREDYLDSQNFVNRRLEENLTDIEEGFEDDVSNAQLEALYSDLVSTITSDLFFPVCTENSVYPNLVSLDDHKSRLTNLIDSVEGRNNRTISLLHRESTILLQKTDCIDFTGDLQDPLESYLCSEGLLTPEACGEVREPVESPIDFADDPINGIPEICEQYADGIDIDPNAPSVNPNNAEFVSPLPPDIGAGRISQGVNSRHAAVDIGIPIGTQLRAIADGICVFSGDARDPNFANSAAEYNFWTPAQDSLGDGFGIGVVVYHPKYNIYTVYAHMSETKCDINQPVRQGDLVGLSGNTGRSTGPHLHFELRHVKNPTTGTWQGSLNSICNDQYCNPTCLFGGNPGSCRIIEDLYVKGKIQVDDSFDYDQEIQDYIDEQCVGNAPIDQINQDDDGSINQSEFDAEIQRLVQSINSSGLSQRTKEFLINSVESERYQEIARKSFAVGDQRQGTTSITDTLGSDYPDSIIGIIEAVGEISGVPAEKIYGQICVESYGGGTIAGDEDQIQNKINSCRDNLTKRYDTGNIDRTSYAFKTNTANALGCLGAGQFCPGTIENFFHPTGNYYDEVRDCVRYVGFDVGESEIINPSYLAASICATSSHLNNSTRVFGDQDWFTNCEDPMRYEDIDGIAGGERIIPTNQLCRSAVASCRYFGACNRDIINGGYNNGIILSSRSTNSHISEYRSFFKQ